MEELELLQDIHMAERQLTDGEGIIYNEALEKLLAGLSENLTTPDPLNLTTPGPS